MTSISSAAGISSTISAAPKLPSAPPSGQQPASASGSSASPQQAAQQKAALSQLLTKYSYDQSHGVDANTIAALGKKIQVAAKALGQHVTLPRAPTATSTADTDNSVKSSAETSTPSSGNVDIKA